MPRADRTTSQDQPISLVSTDETPDLKTLVPLEAFYIPNWPLGVRLFEPNQSRIPILMVYAELLDPMCLDKSSNAFHKCIERDIFKLFLPVAQEQGALCIFKN
jgi:hypothetical protein